MWETRPLEARIEKGLKKQFTAVRGAELYAMYLLARKKLVEEILPKIQGVEPELTDHGPDHIANVLDNANDLLGADKKLTAIDLYCLGLSILFHDAGNIFGRVEHQRNIAKVYDFCLNGTSDQQKSLVLRIAGAHTGRARDETYDTLQELDSTSDLYSKPVQQLDIAAILRFADELAEGPHRTSTFMQEQHAYSPKSLIYHRYAKCSNVQVDKGNERIALTYHYNLFSKSLQADLESLHELLDFTYKRILKLDQERRYASFYSTILTPFKRTSVRLNFYIDGEPVELNLPSLDISDKIVPGEHIKDIAEREPSYAFEVVRERLLASTNRRS